MCPHIISHGKESSHEKESMTVTSKFRDEGHIANALKLQYDISQTVGHRKRLWHALPYNHLGKQMSL